MRKKYKFTFGDGSVGNYASAREGFAASKDRDGVRWYMRESCPGDKHVWRKGEGEVLGGTYDQCKHCDRIRRK